MGTIGGADNFCLQKSIMPIGRIGIFEYENDTESIRLLHGVAGNPDSFR